MRVLSLSGSILLIFQHSFQLDSTSAREVMAAIRALAQAEGIAVIASIHQPSLETLTQFTDVMLLANGRVCYLGRVDEMESFFDQWGRPVSRFVSSFLIKICFCIRLLSLHRSLSYSALPQITP